MHKTSLAIGVVSLALGASACVGNDNGTPKSMPGSYASVPVTDETVVAAAEFAVDAQNKAMSGDGPVEEVRLVSILAAEQQIVSGTNYRLKLRVNRDGTEQTADTVVWWQAWREPDPYRLTSWDWQ